MLQGCGVRGSLRGAARLRFRAGSPRVEFRHEVMRGLGEQPACALEVASQMAELAVVTPLLSLEAIPAAQLRHSRQFEGHHSAATERRITPNDKGHASRRGL